MTSHLKYAGGKVFNGIIIEAASNRKSVIVKSIWCLWTVIRANHSNTSAEEIV